MKKLITTLIATALAVSASALTIDLSLVDCTPSSDDHDFLYKINFDGSVEEGQTDLFSTIWDLNGEGEAEGATISYDGTDPLSINEFIIKAGKTICSFVVSWDGSEDLILENWEGKGISHISLFGSTSPDPGPGPGPNPVPDSGTTLALLGAALLGVISLRRFKK